MNPVGYIPIVSISTATVRLLLATAEIVTGIAMLALAILTGCNGTLAKTSFKYIVHGFANGCRSVPEYANLFFCCCPCSRLLRDWDQGGRISYLSPDIRSQYIPGPGLEWIYAPGHEHAPHVRKPRKVEPPILPEVTFGKGLRFAEAREVLDWRSNNTLFNPLYIDALYTAIDDEELGGYLQQRIRTKRANFNTDSNQQIIKKARKDLRNIHTENRVKLVQFLADLMTSTTNFGMDNPNTDRLRQAILAIFNTLHARREECRSAEDHTAFYATYNIVVTQLMEALTHCSNRINTHVEDLLYGLIRRETTLEGSILLALQKYRHDLLEEAIKNAIDELEDEASTVNYYLRTLGNQFGLPPTLSAFDATNAWVACKGKETEIRSYFDTHYTPDSVVRRIHKIINDPQDPEISTQRFNDWMLENLGERREECLDEYGCYKAELVAAALKHFNIITVTKDLQKKIQPFELVRNGPPPLAIS